MGCGVEFCVFGAAEGTTGGCTRLHEAGPARDLRGLGRSDAAVVVKCRVLAKQSSKQLTQLKVWLTVRHRRWLFMQHPAVLCLGNNYQRWIRDYFAVIAPVFLLGPAQKYTETVAITIYEDPLPGPIQLQLHQSINQSKQSKQKHSSSIPRRWGGRCGATLDIQR